MSYQEALVLFALLLRFDKKLFYPLFYYCNFSTYNQNATTTAIDLQSALNTQQAVWLFVFLVWRHHLQKENKSSGAHFQTFLSKIYLFFDVPQ